MSMWRLHAAIQLLVSGFPPLSHLTFAEPEPQVGLWVHHRQLGLEPDSCSRNKFENIEDRKSVV